MRVVDKSNSKIFLEDEYGQVINVQCLITAKSGGGKGLAMESIAEEFYKKGYTVIAIADPKNEFELAYPMFLPEKEYHLQNLKAIGKRPQKKPVKLYHPFTFSLPKRKLPEMNIFTIPIKSLGQKECGLITETSGQSDVVLVMLRAINQVSKNDSIVSFGRTVYDLAGNENQKITKKIDSKTLLPQKTGTSRELSRVSNYIDPFYEHYFLGKDSELNLDWKRILNDNNHYHVFINKYLGKKEEKLSDFIVLYLLESIVRNSDFAKKPILILIPEVRKLTPDKAEGHKKFLAISIKENLSLLRSTGSGMSTICDTQVYLDIEEDVRKSFTETFFGALDDKDIEFMKKTVGYKAEIVKELLTPEKKNTFIRRGDENSGGYTFFMPESMHSEPEYHFEEMYRKHYPEKLTNYSELIERMKNEIEEDREKVRKLIEKERKEVEEIEETKKQEKEEKKAKSEKVQEKDEKIKEMKNEKKETLMKLYYEMYNDFNLPAKERSLNKIAKKYKTTHKTVGLWIKEYEENLKKEKEENLNVDFEDKVLAELNS